MSGGARVLIEQAPGQTRALHLDGDRVVESWHDFRHDPDRTGSVHAVRIDRVFAAQNRATATLADGTPVSVRTTRHDSLTVGGMAVITITAAPRETKPWQAVTGPRLAGPTLVLLPGQGGIAQSARMTSPPADIALDALQDCLDGEAGFGVILRRNAGAAGDLACDAAALIAAWQAGQTGQREEDGPGCLFDPGGLAARIAVQSPHLEIEAVSAGNAEEFGARWDDMIATTTRADLPLAGGGVMWIEPTRALTAIDFDSGTGPLDSLFADAPHAIASQIRLRQLGGLISVDLPRAAPAMTRRLDAALEAALADDPGHPERLGRTHGGLLEIRAPHGRRGPANWAADRRVTGALSVLRQLSLRPQIARPRIECPTATADWLRGPGAAALTALDRQVELVVSPHAATATLIEDRG